MNNKTTEQPDNEEIFEYLRTQGYNFPEVRSAMFTLNKKRIPELARRIGVSRMTVYNVLNGTSDNLDVIRGFSKEFNIDATKAFSDILKFN